MVSIVKISAKKEKKANDDWLSIYWLVFSYDRDSKFYQERSRNIKLTVLQRKKRKTKNLACIAIVFEEIFFA